VTEDSVIENYLMEWTDPKGVTLAVVKSKFDAAEDACTKNSDCGDKEKCGTMVKKWGGVYKKWKVFHSERIMDPPPAEKETLTSKKMCMKESMCGADITIKEE